MVDKISLSLLVVVVVLLGAATSAPWIQGVELDVPREIDPENPVAAHPSDCHVYYIYNYPMTCGEESVFDPGTLSCRAPSDVAGSRPECAGGEETEASDE